MFDFAEYYVSCHRAKNFCASPGRLPFRQASSISVVKSASSMGNALSLEERHSIEAGRIAIPRLFSAIVMAVRASSQRQYISHTSPARSKAESI